MRTIMINGVEIYGDAEPHGPQRFGAEVVNALDKLDLSGVKIEVIVPKSLVDLGRVPCFSNLKIVALDYDLNKFKGRFLFSKLTFPRYVTKNGGYGVDLVLSYPLYGCKAVCLFDCIIKEGTEEYNGLHAKLWRKKYLFFETNAIKRASLIITISEISKQKIIDDYKIDNRKIIVSGTGYEHIRRIKSDTALLEKESLKPNNYFFSAGVGSDRKNFKWILAAAVNNPGCTFVVAGSCDKSLLEQLNDKKLPNLRIVGFVTDEQYKGLLENCIAYIQPSFDEGFGIPPLEALALGRKAIVSNIPIFNEIYGNSVYYIDPYNYNNSDIESILKNNVLPPDEILKKYSWNNISQIILENIINDINRKS